MPTIASVLRIGATSLLLLHALAVDSVPATPWASATGSDAQGTWADLALQGNGITTTMRFRYIVPGTFQMGSPAAEAMREPANHGKETRHQVTLTTGFWLGETEVTRRQWRSLSATDPSITAWNGNASDPLDLPVGNVSHAAASTWTQALNLANPTLVARLPSEAEWEYACRAGSTAPFWFALPNTVAAIVCLGDTPVGDINDPYINGAMTGRPYGLMPVRTVPANPWGLFGMHGNAFEWTREEFVDDLGSSAVTDPTGPAATSRAVLRGGAQGFFGNRCRAAIRWSDVTTTAGSSIGFRVALRREPRGANEPPTAIGFNAGVLRQLMLNGTDPEEQPLRFAIDTPPTKGSLLLDPLDDGRRSRWIYEPALGSSGNDQFTFVAIDDQGARSAPATVTLTVFGIDVPPVAIHTQLSVVAGGSAVIPLDGVVTPGHVPTVTAVAAPAKGTLSGTGSSRTYTPTAGQTGFDRFTFSIRQDGAGSTATGVVRITILPAGSILPARPATPAAPTLAMSGSVPVLSGTGAVGDLVTLYADGILVAQTTVGDGGIWQCALRRLLPGSQSVQAIVSNAAGASALSPARPVVVPVRTTTTPNRRPQSSEVLLATAAGTAVDLPTAGNDADGDAIAMFPSPGLPLRGTLSVLGGQWTYTPEPGWTGSDTTLFVVRDGEAQSPQSFIRVTTSAGVVDHPPVATPRTYTTTRDTPVTVTFSGTDADGHVVTLGSIGISVSDGTLTGSGTANGSTRVFTPPPGFIGTKAIDFTVIANGVTSASGLITVVVVEANQPPTAIPQQLSTVRDMALPITLGGSDPDGPIVNVASVGNPSHGTLSGTGSSRTYVPAPGYTGADSFTFTVTDGLLSSAPATVNIQVIAPGANLAPVVDAGEDQILSSGLTAPLFATVSDDLLPAGSVLTLAWSTISGPGTASVAAASSASTTVTFSAAGTYVLQLSASDGALTGFDTVTITVGTVANQPPVITAPAGAGNGAFILP